MRLLHAAVAEPKHDTTLKQIKEAVPPLPSTSMSFQASVKVPAAYMDLCVAFRVGFVFAVEVPVF
jgi:hypothetical protein